jgi:hypothetical protein
MALSEKPLAQIDQDDLLGLIAEKAAESKTHDYKRDLCCAKRWRQKRISL